MQDRPVSEPPAEWVQRTRRHRSALAAALALAALTATVLAPREAKTCSLSYETLVLGLDSVTVDGAPSPTPPAYPGRVELLLNAGPGQVSERIVLGPKEWDEIHYQRQDSAQPGSAQ